MLTVTLSENKQLLLVKSHYYYMQRIKSIPSATWNQEGKFWEIDIRFAQLLDNEFEDEIYYKTPKWLIFNTPKPNYLNLYKLDANTVAPELIQPYSLYDYQRFGARFAIERINRHGFCIIADDVGLGRQTY